MKKKIKKDKKKDRNEIHADILEDEVDEYKQYLVENRKDLAKSKKLEEDLRRDTQRSCVEHNKLNKKSVNVEVRHDVLVEKLKNKLSSAIFEHQEEEHVEASEIRK